MKDKRSITSGILQSAIQFKGGMDELDDFLDQIRMNDPSFNKTKYLKDVLNIELDVELKSDTIHLPPFRKK
jgi:hypothetical protein